jgi:hypothetical protein
VLSSGGLREMYRRTSRVAPSRRLGPCPAPVPLATDLPYDAGWWQTPLWTYAVSAVPVHTR